MPNKSSIIINYSHNAYEYVIKGKQKVQFDNLYMIS